MDTTNLSFSGNATLVLPNTTLIMLQILHQLPLLLKFPRVPFIPQIKSVPANFPITYTGSIV